MSEEVARRVQAFMDSLPTTDVGGIGGTLSGNALSLAAMRATLEHVLTDEAFERTIALGERWAAGVKEAITKHAPALGVSSVSAAGPNTGSADAARERAARRRRPTTRARALTHLYALNRGILLTPFHNMALMSPATTAEDVDLHSRVFDEMCAELAR